MNYPETKLEKNFTCEDMYKLNDKYKANVHESDVILVKINRDYLIATNKEMLCPCGYAIGHYSHYNYECLSDKKQPAIEKHMFENGQLSFDFSYIDAWDYASNIELENKREIEENYEMEL